MINKRKYDYLELNKRFTERNFRLLYLLTLILLVLWFFPSRTDITLHEENLWNRVRSAQDHVYEWRVSNHMESDEEHDPWKTGLIGVEWSPITTTLGSLPSKRTACDPRWSIVTGRWFDKLGLTEGDRIVIYSSGSFPGILLNVLCAAEDRGLDVFLAVSLGASTWGANVPGFAWPEIGSVLRSGGFTSTRSSFYTLGGGEETGGGISPEGLDILENSARRSGVEILRAGDLSEMVQRKSGLLRSGNVKLLVNIGGSASSLGSDEEVLHLSGGLIMPSESRAAGDGVIAGALEEDIPVIHFLNLRDLCEVTGVPFDSRPEMKISRWKFPFFSLAGVFFFLLFMSRYRRWERTDRGHG